MFLKWLEKNEFFSTEILQLFLKTLVLATTMNQGRILSFATIF